MDAGLHGYQPSRNDANEIIVIHQSEDLFQSNIVISVQDDHSLYSRVKLALSTDSKKSILRTHHRLLDVSKQKMEEALKKVL